MATKVNMNKSKTTSKSKAKTKTKAEAVPVDAGEEALVLGTRTDVESIAARQMTFGEVGGEVDITDMKIPRLELTHGVGELSKVFNPGDIIYNGIIKLAEKGDPVHMSVLSIRKFYRESLKYDPNSDVVGRVFQTLEEVHAAGFTSEWINNKPPGVAKVAEIRVAIECPNEEYKDSFPLTAIAEDGTEYSFGIASWYVTKTAYAPVAKQVFSAAAMLLKGNLPAGRWRLHTIREERNGNVITLPVFRFVGKYPQEVFDFFNSVVNWNS